MSDLNNAEVKEIKKSPKPAVKGEKYSTIRWILFIPAYIVIMSLLSSTGIDFVAYFVSVLVSSVAAAFIAPRKRMAVVTILAGVTVIPLLIPLFSLVYSSTQITYMIIAAVISIGSVYYLERKKAPASS